MLSGAEGLFDVLLSVLRQAREEQTCGNGGSHVILVYTIIGRLSGRDAGGIIHPADCELADIPRLTGATKTAGVSGYY